MSQLTSIGERILELKPSDEKVDTLSQDLNSLKNKVESEAMLSDRDTFTAKRRRIQDVALPIRDNDAVTKSGPGRAGGQGGRPPSQDLSEGAPK